MNYEEGPEWSDKIRPISLRAQSELLVYPAAPGGFVGGCAVPFPSPWSLEAWWFAVSVTSGWW